MKRKLLVFLALAGAVCALTLGAHAERYVSNGSYVAYIGESDYTYLVDPTGVTKALTLPTRDLLSMSDTHVYCLMMDNKLYAIDMAKSSTSIMSNAATAEEIASVTAVPVYTLKDGSLTVTGADGKPVVVATGVTLAGANQTNLYFLDNNGASLKSIPLEGLSSTALVAATQIGAGSAGALSMTVTENSIVLVAADHSLIVVNLTDHSYRYEPAPSQDVTNAMQVGNKLYYYTTNVDGSYHTAGVIESVSADTMTLVNTNTATATPRPAVTATPTPKPTKAPTPKPTKKPSSSSSSSSSSSTYATVRYGNTGSRVKKMQQRLQKLGYPVGKVDGAFGDDTLYALNLFQGDVGYTERKYANSDTLEKLYGKKAPTYDAFRGLKKGDRGIRVRILQTYLENGGYAPGKVDGAYGADTKSAVERFQLACGIPVTGEADKTTLILLYGENGPTYPLEVPPTAPPTYPPVVPGPPIGTQTDLLP